MHKGHVEEANSVAEKIGKLIINRNINQLTPQNTDIPNFDLWAAVKIVICKKQNQQSSNFTAEQLNNHYAMVSFDDNYSEPILRLDNSLKHTPLSEYTVFMKLDKLKPTATGPDGLPSWFLKLSAPIFTEPLTKLINMSLERGKPRQVIR